MWDDYDIADYYEDNTLTNFIKEERPIYEKALKIYKERTGKNNIFIRDTVYDGWVIYCLIIMRFVNQIVKTNQIFGVFLMMYERKL